MSNHMLHNYTVYLIRLVLCDVTNRWMALFNILTKFIDASSTNVLINDILVKKV